MCSIYVILLHFTLFCSKISPFFLAIYAVLSQNRFLQFTRFCVEKKLAQNSICGEKMTNIRYAKTHRHTFSFAMPPLHCKNDGPSQSLLNIKNALSVLARCYFETLSCHDVQSLVRPHPNIMRIWPFVASIAIYVIVHPLQ